MGGAIPNARKPRGRPFKPGNNANPAGRPKGTRNKLSENFVAALFADFEEHGVQAIRNMRAEKPGDYVKVIASLIPAQFQAVDQDGEASGLQIIIRKDL